MASINNLSVKTLVQVLKQLSPNQEIGFDPYRDDRTRTKEKLLGHILRSWNNDQIIAAIKTVEASAQAQATDDEPKVIASEAIPVVDSYVTEYSHKQTTNPKIPEVQTSPEALQLATLLSSMTSKASVDLDTVKREVQIRFEEENDSLRKHYESLTAIVDAKIASLQAPTVVHIANQATGEIKDMGVQHKCFPDLLKACQARDSSGHRMNIWLHGPAGTGKTHATHAIADALGLPFQSNGTLLTEHALSGFIDAGGKYHRTAFREIFEQGGVYLGDEYDVWCPKAAMWLQAALANGYTRFPDGMIKRHSDCVIIFGANTVGKGATSEFSTRNKVDDANSNRVIFQEWPLDEALETAISPNPEWTKRVQRFRAKVEARKLKGHMITPRQSLQGAALLAAGLDWDKVETMVLRRGLSQEHWDSVN